MLMLNLVSKDSVCVTVTCELTPDDATKASKLL